MGSKSSISWTDATWGPWRGCEKISAGCKNCYMFRDQQRYGRDPNKVVRTKTTFEDPLKWQDPKVIFVCSWSDFFIQEADPWREDAWRVMYEAHWHTYMILTKRPERLLECMPKAFDIDVIQDQIWFGVTIEDQKAADERLAPFEHFTFPNKFVSHEPLLGPINMFHWLHEEYPDGEGGRDWYVQPWVDYAIIGGESGPNFREMKMEWARELRAQYAMADVPIHFKQQSAMKPGQNPYIVEEDGSHTYHTWHVTPDGGLIE